LLEEVFKYDQRSFCGKGFRWSIQFDDFRWLAKPKVQAIQHGAK
jgi:hypothetical protein